MQLRKKIPLYPVILYFSWRLIIFIYQIFVQPFIKITPDSDTLSERLFNSWIFYWDSAHYISIAEKGYVYPQQAFFPFWPMLLKVFLFIPEFIGVYLLITLLGLVCFILFYKLALKLTNQKNAKLALLLFCSFPASMYLLTAYSESLFICLSLISFLLIEDKKYFLSSIFVGLTSVTRLLGIMLSLVFVFLKIRLIDKIKYISISLAGIFTYLIFLKAQYGDFLYFAKAQKEWCANLNNCILTSPLDPILGYFNLLILGWVKPGLSSTFIDWLFAVIFLMGSFFVLKKLKSYYFFYSISLILLPLSAGVGTIGMVRYVLPIFPVFFIFPQVVKNKILFAVILIVLLLLQLRFVALYSSRIWVA